MILYKIILGIITDDGNCNKSDQIILIESEHAISIEAIEKNLRHVIFSFGCNGIYEITQIHDAELGNYEQFQKYNMSERFKELFYEHYKPYAVPPVLGLTEKFLTDRGYTKEDFEKYVSSGFIEQTNTGYRMTKETLKDFLGENSWYYKNIVTTSR